MPSIATNANLANQGMPLSETQRRLQNAVQQLIALKNAQAQSAAAQTRQHAAGLLDALCQPRKGLLSVQDQRFGNTADLPPQLGLMRLQLQKAVHHLDQLHG